MDESLQSVLPSMEDCRAEARTLSAAHPHTAAADLAALAARSSRARGATLGGLVLGGPSMLGDFMRVLKKEARLAGVIAAVLAPDEREDEAAFHADILAIVFPRAVEAALHDAGVAASAQTSKQRVRAHVSKPVFERAVHFAAKFLGREVSQRMSPRHAAGDAATWLGVRATGRRALSYHQHQPLEMTPA